MAIALLLRPKPRDLGSFTVRRVLPAVEARMVGPFVFFDEMGPVAFAPGEGMDVRPHPPYRARHRHLSLRREIVHRDSLGVVHRSGPAT